MPVLSPRRRVSRALWAGLLFACALAPQQAAAQDGLPRSLRPSASPRSLTLDDAFAIAATSSFDVRIADARLEQARAQVRQAWSAVLPHISLGGEYDYNFPEVKVAFSSSEQLQQQALLYTSLANITDQTAALNPDPRAQRAAAEQSEGLRDVAKQLQSQGGTDIVISPAHVVNGALTASMPIFSARLIPLVQNAYAGLEISELTRTSIRSGALFSVARAYFQVVATKRVVEIAATQVASAQQHLERAQQRLDQGMGTVLMLKRAQLDLARAQQQQTSAAQGLRATKAALGGMLAINEDFDVVEPPPVAAIENGLTLERALEDAYAHRPDLRIQKRALEIADRGRLDAWLSLLPSVNLQAQGRATSNTSGFNSNPVTGVIALQAQIPIFDGGMTFATIAESNAKVKEQVLKVHQLVDNIESQVRGALEDVTVKTDAARTASEVADLARAQKAVVDDQLEVGAATGLDVTDASLAVFGAEVDAVRARLDLETARLTVAYLLGQLVPAADSAPSALDADEETAQRAAIGRVPN